MPKKLSCNESSCKKPVIGFARAQGMERMGDIPGCQDHLEEIRAFAANVCVEYLP